MKYRIFVEYKSETLTSVDGAEVRVNRTQEIFPTSRRFVGLCLEATQVIERTNRPIYNVRIQMKERGSNVWQTVATFWADSVKEVQTYHPTKADEEE